LYKEAQIFFERKLVLKVSTGTEVCK